MPRAPLPGSVVAATSMTAAAGAFVMKFFVPLSTSRHPFWPFWRTAVVRWGGGVGAGLGLRQREAADFLARRQVGQPARALRIRPGVGDGRAHERVLHRHDDAVDAQAREISSSAST
jgi:hypothetical protein